MKEQKGNPYQVPVQLRTHAPRQTEERRVAPRYRQSRTQRSADIEDDDAVYSTRPHTSAIRCDRPVAQRRETTHLPPAKATKVIHHRRLSFARFLIIFGLLSMVVLLGIMAFSALSSWWTTQNNDWTYGRPRTSQVDQYVGQGDSLEHPNHFIALNLKGVVEVVEINTQNAQLDHVYYITTTTDPLNPVTLSFPTIDGKQYLYVSIGNANPYTIALVNDGKAFVGVQH